ncbi:unnamed protein product, partial [Aphanomyces euteiches]
MASNENRGCVAIQTAANQHKHLDFVFDMEAADGVNWTAVKRLQGVIKSEVEEQVADIVKTEPTVQVVETKRVPPPPVKQDSDPFVRGILDLIIE